jgi:hypothetical protein
MSHISRRTWLKGLGLFSVVVGNALMLVSTAAEPKPRPSGDRKPL